MFSPTKSRTFRHKQLITDSHGPHACIDLHCKEWRKGSAQWYPKLAGGEGEVLSALPEPSSCREQHPQDKSANPGQPIPESQYHSPSCVTYLDHRWALRSHQVIPGQPWEWKKYLSVPFSSRNCRAFSLERRWGKTWWVVAANFSSPHCLATFVTPL